MNEDLKTKIDSVPAMPGVYQFIDSKGKIIYVGKAKNLRSRVRSYFQANLNSPKTEALVNKISDLQLFITDSEVEALVLENNLIKKYKPRYNVNLKDDKSYPYIRITNEPYPQIFHTRQIIKDGSKYFGPFTDVKTMKRSLRLINKIFKIRSCKYYIDSNTIEKKKIKVCLDYHIKRCDGPCEGLISRENYNNLVNQVIKVLQGKTEGLIKELKTEMRKAADALQFEKAAELRDRIEQLNIYSSKQKIVSTDFRDRDVIAAVNEAYDAACTILNIREGKLVGKRQFHLKINPDIEKPELLNSVLKFYYNEFVEIPAEIILENEPSDADSILRWLNQSASHKVEFIIPKRASEKKSLLNMCSQNATLFLKDIQLQKMKKEGNLPYVLSALKRDLHLPVIPRKIECFDISNIQGSDSVAGMVVFVDGKPSKSNYRKFIIKNVEGPDDFASMREVFKRRYSKLKENNEPLPELIIVDGGKGQLSSAFQILKSLGFEKFNIIGLAKRLEEIFYPGITEAQTIPKTSSSLKLLQKIRDEAHRYAITFHRSRRFKRTLQTELTSIKGIGEKTATILLKYFGSVKKIKNATEKELIKAVGKAKAALLFNYYHPQFNEKSRSTLEK